MGSNNKRDNNIDFVGMATGGFNVRSRRNKQEVEMPQEAKAMTPPQKATGEDLDAMRQRIREELRAEVTDEVRSEIQKEQATAQKTPRGFAKASPAAKTVKSSVKADKKTLDKAVKENSEEVTD